MAETQTQTQGDSDVANHRADITPRVPTYDERIPQILLNEGLRLFFLRAVVASSLVTTGFMLYATIALGSYGQSKPTLKWSIPAVLLVVFTTVHHIGTSFGPRFPLPVWVDICLTVLESMCCVVAIGYLTHFSNQLGAQWFPSYGLAALVGLWILSFSIIILALLKTINLASGHGTSPYHLPVVKGGPQRPPSWWKYPAHNLFGRRMWGRNVPGESKWLARLRGFIALMAVCALVAFGLYQTIVTPIAELGKIPHRAYRIAGLDYTTAMDVLNATDTQYSLLLLWSRHQDATANLTSAVAVNARWRQQAGPVLLQEAVACQVRRVGNSVLTGELNRRIWDVAAATCPKSPNQQEGNANAWWDFPNFELGVNYTGLLGSAGAVSSDKVSDTLRVYLGFTRNLERTFVNSEPVSLFPGTNILSVANVVLLQTLDPTQLGTFGFESYDNFLVASIAQTISNPYFPPAASNPNISTLAFALQNVQGGWTVLQDYRSKSVLSGLSALGGLGSLLSTILAVLLGTSLVQAILRTKPNSPFGLLHNADSLQEERAKQYPQLPQDIIDEREKRGIVAYLFNTLIDGEDSLKKNTEHNHGEVKDEEEGSIDGTRRPEGHNQRSSQGGA